MLFRSIIEKLETANKNQNVQGIIDIIKTIPSVNATIDKQPLVHWIIRRWWMETNDLITIFKILIEKKVLFFLKKVLLGVKKLQCRLLLLLESLQKTKPTIPVC